MRIKPNKTILHGRVNRVQPAAEGYGANVEFLIEASEPASGFADFLQAAPGSTATIFAADPQAVQPGRAYTLTITVLGGPQGERIVLEDARAKAQ
jgi:hypothetical protein